MLSHITASLIDLTVLNLARENARQSSSTK
jgi:hypothetical protein